MMGRRRRKNQKSTFAILALLVIAVVLLLGLGINRMARKQLANSLQNILSSAGDKYEVGYDGLSLNLWSGRLELSNVILQNPTTKKSWQIEKIRFGNWHKSEALALLLGLETSGLTQISFDFERLHLTSQNLTAEGQKVIHSLSYNEMILSFGGQFSTEPKNKKLSISNFYAEIDQGGRFSFSGQFQDYDPRLWAEMDTLPLSSEDKLKMRRALLSKLLVVGFTLQYDDASLVSRIFSARQIDRAKVNQANVLQIFLPMLDQTPAQKFTLQPVFEPQAPRQAVNKRMRDRRRGGRAIAQTVPPSPPKVIGFKQVSIPNAKASAPKSEFMDLFVAQLLTFIRSPHTFTITAQPESPMMMGQVADLFRSNRDAFARLLRLAVVAK